VIASLWEVEDVSTATLMRDFYKSLDGSSRDVPRALQHAQGALRATRGDGGRPYQHPYYWAGFVVSGR
jgi:CHAT domain-containing protein